MRDTTSHALKLKFADMPSGIANRWLDWARSHDWGRNAKFLDTGKMLVTDFDGETLLAATPKELRDWAGY